ncbi:MAG: hypothetical protein DRJ69_06580, partial [Thermoprotei archaeon]
MRSFRIVETGACHEAPAYLGLGSSEFSGLVKPCSLRREVLFLHPGLVQAAYRYLKSVWPKVRDLKAPLKVAELASRISSESYGNLTMEPFYGGQLSLYVYKPDGSSVR